jgi:hypothetical protein
MIDNIFDSINQISVLANEVRFRIALVLFNSDNIFINNNKLGSHSCSAPELESIVKISPTDLQYHLGVMIKSNLIEKVPDNRGYYHITEDCKEILKMFGVNSKLIKEAEKELKLSAK